MTVVTDDPDSAQDQTGAVDRDRFVVEADSYRRELVAHCYKMVGSIHEAEDLVQETYVRAWRSWDSFEGRSSVRTWLYRIATNLCLTALNPRHARLLPAGLTASAQLSLETASADPVRTPFPTGSSGLNDPAETADARAGLRLALITSLQLLPPRQRAVFILREALGYSAGEIAGMLNMSVVAVRSALQRARARLDEVGPVADEVAEPNEAATRRVLEQYMLAFETADIELLTRLLRAETVLTVHPNGPVLDGMEACLQHLSENVLTAPDIYRMIPTSANGQPAAVAYRRHDATDEFVPFGVAVLTTSGDRISRIDTFIDPALVTVFGENVVAPAR
jgi:RNA polymerase sigma-70 factor (ECF subfamily)